MGGTSGLAGAPYQKTGSIIVPIVSKEMNRDLRFDHCISMLIHPKPSRVNQIASCRLIFQLWKLPSPVRDGCIYCEYKWIIDVNIVLLDSTTVLVFRSRTEAHAAEGRC
jgi:hypothetical protein